MTNKQYCNMLYYDDLPLACKVIEKFINQKCGRYATVVEKEVAFGEWCEQEYDPDEWKKCSRKPQATLWDYGGRQIRVGCIQSALTKATQI